MTARYLRGLGDTNILIYLERMATDHSLAFDVEAARQYGVIAAEVISIQG